MYKIGIANHKVNSDRAAESSASHQRDDLHETAGDLCMSCDEEQKRAEYAG